MPDARVIREIEADLKQLIQTVEVKPLDYPGVRIARNPMAPLVGGLLPRLAPGEEPPVITRRTIDTMAAKEISGIIWAGANPLAVVDDIVVHVGYVFPNGVEVLDIERNRVLFKVGDTVVPVEMKEF